MPPVAVAGKTVLCGALAFGLFACVVCTVHVDPAEAAVPDTRIESGPSGTIGTAGTSLVFSSNDSTAGFDCRLDSAGWQACSTPKTYQSLSDGSHTFQVRAVDGTAGIDPTPAERNWVTDTSAPAIELAGSLKEASDLNQPLTESSYQLTSSASDGAAVSAGVRSIEIRVAGTRLDRAEQDCPQGGCSLSLDSTFRPDDFNGGQHTITAVATDELGHQAERTFTVTVPNDPKATAIPDTLPCTGPDEPPNFPVYSLGPVFEALPVSNVLRQCDPPYPGEPVRTNRVAYLYGYVPASCPEDPPNIALCVPPLQIHSWPACERSLADYELEPGVAYPRTDLGQVRGVPASAFNEGYRVELYTGASTIVMFGPDAAQLLRATAAIRTEPMSTPLGMPSLLSATDTSSELPDPIPGAMTGELRCSA